MEQVETNILNYDERSKGKLEYNNKIKKQLYHRKRSSELEYNKTINNIKKVSGRQEQALGP